MVRAIRLCLLLLLLTMAGAPVLAQGTQICQGTPVNLKNFVSVTGDPNSYKWSDGTRTISTSLDCSVSPTSTTTYTLNYTYNGQGRTQSLVVTVYETPDLHPTMPADITICSGDPVELKISMSNAGPTTSIIWRNDSGQTYTDGAKATNATGAGRTYTYTATVRNHPTCPPVSKSFTATVNLKPTAAKITRIDWWPKCKDVPFDLNSLVTFEVIDNYGNSAPGTVNSGSITWYTPSHAPVAPSTVTPTGPNDTSFYADYSGIQIVYNASGCTSFDETFAGGSTYSVKIPVSSSVFSLGDNHPCRGDSLMAFYTLIDEKTGDPSACDGIKELQILKGDRDHSISKINKTSWIVTFAPLTGTATEDSIMVKLVSEAGIDTTYTHKLRPSTPPAPKDAPTVCKGEDITFYVAPNGCDTIRRKEDITFTGLEAYTYTITQMPEPDTNRYKVVVEKLLDNKPSIDTLSFGYTIYYDSNYENASTHTTGTYTLHTHNDPPYVVGTVNNKFFNINDNFNVTPNLCLGDVLNYTVYPETCNTITAVTFLVNNVPVYPASPNEGKYTVQPTSKGTHTIKAIIDYHKPEKVTSVTHIWYINVIDRPHLFMNNQNADTTGFCMGNMGIKKIDLNTNGKIDYTYGVKTGTAVFSDPDLNNSHELEPVFSGDHIKKYNVKATYQHICSEMPADSVGHGELYITFDEPGFGGVPGTLEEPSKFCVTDGIYISDEDKAEGTTWEWTCNGAPISFPYEPPPGSYTLTVKVTNACQSSGTTTTRQAIVDDLPRVEAMPPSSVCAGTTVTLAVQPGHIGALEWNATSPATITETTTFTATVTNACGSMHDDVTIFRIPDAMVRTIEDTSACYGHTIPLNIIDHEGTLAWYNVRYPEPLTGLPPQVKITATEMFRVVATNECGAHTAYLNVRCWPLPFVEVVNDSSICHGEPFLSQVHRSVGELTWQPDPTQMQSVTEPVTFTVTAAWRILPQCGSHSDTLNLAVYPPLELQPTTLPPYKRKQAYDVEFETLHAEPPVEYTFSASTLPPKIYTTTKGIRGTPDMGPADYNTHEVNVKVIDAHGCKVTADYALKPAWSAATAFTPLENSNNIFLPDFYVEIYTRNGTLLYKSDGETGGWNGMSNDRLVDAGTYFYKATAVFDGIVKQYTGYTTVMYR